jgi:hypothetical protein
MRKSPDTINFNHFKEFSIKEILTAKSESIRPRCLQARTNHQSSIAKWEKFHHVQNLPSSPWWRSVLNIRNVLDRSWRTGNWRRPHLRLLRHGDRFHRSTSHTKLLAWNIIPQDRHQSYTIAKDLWMWVSLHWSRMLFQGHQLQRLAKTNRSVGWIVGRMPPIDPSKFIYVLHSAYSYDITNQQ